MDHRRRHEEVDCHGDDRRRRSERGRDCLRRRSDRRAEPEADADRVYNAGSICSFSGQNDVPEGDPVPADPEDPKPVGDRPALGRTGAVLGPDPQPGRSTFLPEGTKGKSALTERHSCVRPRRFLPRLTPALAADRIPRPAEGQAKEPPLRRGLLRVCGRSTRRSGSPGSRKPRARASPRAGSTSGRERRVAKRRGVSRGGEVVRRGGPSRGRSSLG